MPSESMFSQTDSVPRRSFPYRRVPDGFPPHNVRWLGPISRLSFELLGMTLDNVVKCHDRFSPILDYGKANRGCAASGARRPLSCLDHRRSSTFSTAIWLVEVDGNCSSIEELTCSRFA